MPPGPEHGQEGTTSHSTSVPNSSKLARRIFWGLLAGAGFGLAVNGWIGSQQAGVQWVVSNLTEPVGQFFLRLLLLLVLPLVFSSLLMGVAGLGDIGKLGRVGLKSFGYCLVVSALSVALALGLTNVIKPGKRVGSETERQLRERYHVDAAKQVGQATSERPSEPVLMQVVKTLVPKNPVASVASETPNMLHLMFFSLVLGVGTMLLPARQTATWLGAVGGLYAISAKLIELVMHLAPVAVACLVFTNVALFGLDLLRALGWFMLTVLAGLALQLFGVYSLLLRWLSRMSPREFFRQIRVVMLTAFSTSSSNATLPTTLRVAEENLKLPRDISSFVLTVGATANQNGTALYEGVTVLFLAQLAGIELSLGQQITVAYLAVLGSIGTAGVPSGSIPFIILVLATLGINPALIAIILGVDRVLDMCRTVVNVAGDLAAATYVARSEADRANPP